MTKTIKDNISGIAITGVWTNEGHTVSFIEDGPEMKITEVMRGNTWQSLGRNWSMNRRVSISEAIEEQDKLIKYGYARMN